MLDHEEIESPSAILKTAIICRYTNDLNLLVAQAKTSRIRTHESFKDFRFSRPVH